MTNFDILSTEQLLEVKGGSNELTNRDTVDECIV
ncbi:bacteriocin class II family protein [Sulfurimonas sp.]|nr:bacteriocin class II family protein [Sulfurimonas sp.]